MQSVCTGYVLETWWIFNLASGVGRLKGEWSFYIGELSFFFKFVFSEIGFLFFVALAVLAFSH